MVAQILLCSILPVETSTKVVNAPSGTFSPSANRVEAKTATMSLTLPPVVERELRVALHKRGATDLRLKVARYGVIAVSLFMLFGTIIGTGRWGRTLQFYLFLAGLGMAIGPALQISVGLFAEERRQQTLELLYLTGMGSAELFVGKLLGAALVSSSELLALAPLLAVPFLSGGVSFELFLETLTCLPTLFVLVLAIGALASALSRQEATALIITAVFAGILCLALPLPYNLGFWLTGKVPFDKNWLALSAVLGPWIVSSNSGVFLASDFWRWATAMWALSFVCLVVAALVLKRNWRRDMQRVDAEPWQKYWEALVLGDAGRRRALRQRVLETNAYQWLAQQDRRPVVQAWGFTALVCLFWFLGWCAWPRVWATPLNFYTTGIVILAGVDWLASQAGARRMAADRRDGSLELLLTTPLNPVHMLAGQKAALDEQFRPVKLGVFGLLLAMAAAGFLPRAWTTQGVIAYLAVWSLLLAWCWRPARRAAPMAMWVAANCGRSVFGGVRRGGSWNRIWTIYWVWMMARTFGGVSGFARSLPTGSVPEMAITLFIVLCLLILLYAIGDGDNAMAQPLTSQLRSIAQEPLPERNDPRFKEWKDIRQRFPAAEGSHQWPPYIAEAQPIKAAGAWLWRPVGRLSGLAWGNLQKAAKRRVLGNARGAKPGQP